MGDASRHMVQKALPMSIFSNGTKPAHSGDFSYTSCGGWGRFGIDTQWQTMNGSLLQTLMCSQKIRD